MRQVQVKILSLHGLRTEESARRAAVEVLRVGRHGVDVMEDSDASQTETGRSRSGSRSLRGFVCGRNVEGRLSLIFFSSPP